MKSFSVGSFVLGIALGALLTGAWFLGGTSLSIGSATVPPVETNGTATTSESGAVSVAAQPAGMSVVVDSVTVPPPGVWVAVVEMSGNSLGNVLGAARVTGPRSTISIPLLRATQPGRSYAVELYRDDGDGSFDLAKDSAYVDFDTGSRVIVPFAATN